MITALIGALKVVVGHCKYLTLLVLGFVSNRTRSCGGTGSADIPPSSVNQKSDSTQVYRAPWTRSR